MASKWLLWQLADSAFPAGALAHSGGLEAAMQLGLVRDRDSLREFVVTILQQSHRGVAVFLNRVWLEPDAFEKQDRECDLFLNSSIANRASRSQGQAFLATAARTFDVQELRQRAIDVRRMKLPCHFSPIIGWIGQCLSMPRESTLELFAFFTARSCLSSAVRLGVIGPLEAQHMLATLSPPLEIDPSADPVQIAPVLDLVQSTQDRLYSRLFQS
ncbi:MAG: urease accessory protein UreF [Phycisphaerae bacterium]|nr:urease accessory protein UreF [Phycisphaerae bacterium]